MPPTYVCPPCALRMLLASRSSSSSSASSGLSRQILSAVNTSRSRFLSTNPTSAPSPPPVAGHVNLTSWNPSSSSTITTTSGPHRTLVTVHGPDATRFLQGVTTINVEKLATKDTSPTGTTSSYCAFLTAQGRILHEGFLYLINGNREWRERYGEVSVGGVKKWDVDDPCWIVEVSRDGGEELKRWLGRYKLRSKISIVTTTGDGDGEWNVWVEWGGRESGIGNEIPIDMINNNLDNTPHVHDTRAPGLFTRYLLPSRTAPSPSIFTTPKANLTDYILRRYLHGIAEGPQEVISGKALPHEWNMDLSGHGIDFRKGCYVGQELTVRTEHRGVVRKRVVPVQVFPEGDDLISHRGVTYNPHIHPPLPPPTIDAEIISSSQNHSEGSPPSRTKPSGKWLAGIGNIGLALVRLDSMFPLGGDIGTSEAGKWGGEKFRLQWEEELGNGEEVVDKKTKKSVGVRAWMPGWHFRDGLEGEGEAEGKE